MTDVFPRKVMISSTLADLRAYRAAVSQACKERGFYPLLNEDPPASSDDPVTFTLRFVDEADIYIGIIGFRYSTLPAGYDKSYVELEYERARARKIPCLIFLMESEGVTDPSLISAGDDASRLEAFKRQLLAHHVVNYFRHPDELALKVKRSLEALVAQATGQPVGEIVYDGDAAAFATATASVDDVEFVDKALSYLNLSADEAQAWRSDLTHALNAGTKTRDQVWREVTQRRRAGQTPRAPRRTLKQLAAEPYAQRLQPDSWAAFRLAGQMAAGKGREIDSTLLLAAILHRAPKSDWSDPGTKFLNYVSQHFSPPPPHIATGWFELSLVSPYGITEFPQTQESGGEEFAIADEIDVIVRVADQFAAAAFPEGKLQPRDLLAAIIAPVPDPAPTAQVRLTQMGVDLVRLRAEIIISVVETPNFSGLEVWDKLLLPKLGAGGASPGGGAGPSPAGGETGPTSPPSAAVTPAQAVQESVLGASTSDQPTADDTLGFGPYVKALAKFLAHTRTTPPLTMSVEGEWGSGKSSFMLQLDAELLKRNRERLKRARRTLRHLQASPQTGEPGREIYNRLKLRSPFQRAAVRRRLRIFTVRFNAWRHDKEDALWASFALDFIRQLSQQLSPPQRLWAYLKLLALRFKWQDGWLVILRAFFLVAVLLFITGVLVSVLYSGGIEKLAPTATQGGELKPDQLFLQLVRASGWVGYVAIALFVVTKLKDYIGNPLSVNLTEYIESPNYGGHVAFVESFHEDFKKIIDTYAGGGKVRRKRKVKGEDEGKDTNQNGPRNKVKVYVFIDDLDRCDVPKAAELMQALNLMISDSPQLIFVIGMDREKVAAGLAVKYEKLLPYLAQAMPQAAPADSPAAKSAPPAGQLTAATPGGPDMNGGLEFGYNFIEKFVQLPFRIPEPDEPDLRRLLNMLSPSGRGDGRAARRRQPTEEATAAPSADSAPPARSTGGRTDVPFASPPAHVLLASPPAQLFTDMQAVDSPLSPPEAALQAERRSIFTLLATGDSETVRNIILMVASALGNNPRRLKQFINMFRLKAFIAAETGLNEYLTLEQLGKFVAISLRWPRLLPDLEVDLKLLAELQQRAVDPALSKSGDSNAIKYWGARRELNKLLRYGCVAQPGDAIYDPPVYSLAQVDVKNLLRISAVRTRGGSPEGAPKKPSPAPG